MSPKNQTNAGAKKVDAQRLLDAIAYNAETGDIVWKHRPRDHFKSDRCFKTWNSTYEGNSAFSVKTSNGYLKGRFDGYELLAHRVAWLVISGDWPKQDVDHINGDRSNNSARNLRAVSRSDNLKNKGWNGNACGCIGVSFHKASGKFHARIMSRGRTISLGYYDSIDDAKNARLSAERVHGFHENHGRPL